MSTEANDVSNGSVPPKAKKPKAEIETVTINDGSGRTSDFAGKRRMNKEYELDEQGNLVGLRVDFRSGDTRFYEPHPQLFGRFAGHGMSQKYGDETAGLKPAEGQDEVDIDDLILAMDDLHGRL